MKLYVVLILFALAQQYSIFLTAQYSVAFSPVLYREIFLCSSPEPVAYSLHRRAFTCLKWERECDCNLLSALIDVCII